MENRYGKNIFVTGASSGIGLACARYFAMKGCFVTGVSRNIKEGKETFESGGILVTKKLDVTDDISVKEFVSALDDVDIAILCAGMGIAGPAETTPMEMTKKQMEVNYFGTLNTALCCLGRMREKGSGLLLVIGSIAGRVSIPMQSQYSASKYALEAFTDAVRMEMKGYGVKACIIEPGDTKTGFTDARDILSDDKVYKEVIERSVGKMAEDERNGKSPETVAKAAYRLACRKNPPARLPVGAGYKFLMFLLKILPDGLKEYIISRMYL